MVGGADGRGDHQGESFVVAVDKRTGEERRWAEVGGTYFF